MQIDIDICICICLGSRSLEPLTVQTLLTALQQHAGAGSLSRLRDYLVSTYSFFILSACSIVLEIPRLPSGGSAKRFVAAQSRMQACSHLYPRSPTRTLPRLTTCGSLGLQIATSRSHVSTSNLKVGISYVLGALGYQPQSQLLKRRVYRDYV